MNAQELIRVASLWYEDGGIVLRAGNRLFRVYRGILIQQCEVFKDMFTVVQPSVSEEDMYDGCPLILLQDDVDEMEWFLKAIFDSRSLPNPEDGFDYRQLSSILRLSHKYDNAGLKRRTLQQFTASFMNSPLSSSRARPPCHMDLEDRLHCIPLCLETGALWLTPYAIIGMVDPEHQLEQKIVLRWKEHPQLIIQIFQGLRLHMTLIHRTLRKLSFQCSDRDEMCQTSVFLFNCELTRKLDDIVPGNHGIPIYLNMVMRDIKEALTRPDYYPRLGEACKKRIVSLIRECVVHEWAALPGMYGFGSWEELDALKAKALGESKKQRGLT
ncbi:hypothetical protein DL96DRAFT_1502436 [Flagelloscypha sp. PMI_526]|nr:hypothetical protein DL96DRAFT_1502436 [Flagelloscypha sp. PMI_526]